MVHSDGNGQYVRSLGFPPQQSLAWFLPFLATFEDLGSILCHKNLTQNPQPCVSHKVIKYTFLSDEINSLLNARISFYQSWTSRRELRWRPLSREFLGLIFLLVCELIFWREKIKSWQRYNVFSLRNLDMRTRISLNLRLQDEIGNIFLLISDFGTRIKNQPTMARTRILFGLSILSWFTAWSLKTRN